MNKIYTWIRKNNYFHIDYNIELFAGMYWKPKKKHFPTILLFRTGSFTMMGAKDEKIVKLYKYPMTHHEYPQSSWNNMADCMLNGGKKDYYIGEFFPKKKVLHR